MRRPILGLAVVLGVSLVVPTNHAWAQVGGLGGDPFSLYYGYYLPHQAAVAAQPTPLDTINAATAARIPSAVDRRGLYDPNSIFGDEELDPLRPFSSRGGRTVRPHIFPQNTTTARGLGTAGFYFNRRGQYHTNVRQGTHPNANLSVTRKSRGGGGGGGGMPSMAGPR